jgi:elongation factor Ts
MIERYIESYVHGNRIGVLVELETMDVFITRTEEFKLLAHEICLQLAALDPRHYFGDETVLLSEDQDSEGLRKMLSEPFVKDSEMTMRERIQKTEQLLSAPIKIIKLVRFETKCT